jgi:hypothetical protein
MQGSRNGCATASAVAIGVGGSGPENRGTGGEGNVPADEDWVRV